jgi:DNA-binding SARP family transcriptional activator
MASMSSSRRSTAETLPLEEPGGGDSHVDTRDGTSLSFARPNPPSPPTSIDRLLRAGRVTPVAVGPGRPRIVAPILDPKGLLGTMPEYPIQISKVQAPPLRDQTLARERLLEWLGVKIHNRAVLVIAEAGYGKTTLLADFSRRTRLRTLWFRLDHGDRDWVGFIAYLVAAVRIHVPGFGPATDSLLRETASVSPSRDTVLDTFLRELGDLPPDPTALIFDDFHLVDDAPDIRHIAIELLARAPERLSFVFASRRVPPVRLARLRALGEVAELATDDLRFDATETERLFRDTYEMRLEPALIAELSQRTEGWAASLQLVRSALHDRNPAQIRAFVRSLSGAEGHLYDYLAEEVVGDLPEELQQFLMRTSILETIDLVLGPVAAGVTATAAGHLMDEGERLGLFGRRGPNTRHQVRAHPLVREFLQSRLLRSDGAPGVAEIHRRSAKAAESLDWRFASQHYLAAGDEDDARRVLTESIETILATGAYGAAHELAASLSAPIAGSAGLVLASRVAQQGAHADLGLEFAERAHSIDPGSRPALLNLVTARSLAGDTVGAIEAGRMLQLGTDDLLAKIARSYQRMIETSIDLPMPVAIAEMSLLSVSLVQRGDLHFLGVAKANIAYVLRAAGQIAESRTSAEEAVSLLEETSAGIELRSARLALAWALAFDGDLPGARDEMTRCLERVPDGQLIEVVFECGEIEALFGETDAAWPLFRRIDSALSPESDVGQQALLVRSLLAVRDHRFSDAAADASQIQARQPRTSIAFELRRILGLALISIMSGDGAHLEGLNEGIALAELQGAKLWEDYGRLLLAVAEGSEQGLSDEISHIADTQRPILSMAAEPVLLRLGDLNAEALAVVSAEAAQRPWRWRPSTRRLLASDSEALRLNAANLLELIGDRSDIPRLREVSRSFRDRRGGGLGRSLARRLAARVWVEDLGRVQIRVGEVEVDGAVVRRKVLALLCLLISKSRFSATREHVLESLWPDLDPASALNSLNQTVYFLRRVFELDYRDDTSPGYVSQDGETIWLDLELVDSRSRRCKDQIRGLEVQIDPERVATLAADYVGRFALDFAYEEWAGPYRDSLHAAYLRVIEHAIRLDIDTGHFARGIYLAERAADVEPESEEIQVALVRLYRLSGAHAAAAEQYGHYAQTMRDLGVDPPAFADV